MALSASTILYAIGQWVQQWGQILYFGGSLLLSYLLVRLYRRQQSLLEAERQAAIEVSDYQVDVRELRLWISNFGHGRASNLRLAIETEFPNDDTLVGKRHTRPLEKVVDEDSHRRMETSIKPHQEAVPFKVQPNFSFLSDDYHFVTGFEMGTESILEHGKTKTRFKCWIEYDNELDRESEVFVDIFRTPVRVDSPMSFEQVHLESQ